MHYSDSVTQLYSLGYELHGVPGHKFELSQVRALLAALGDPQRKFASVLVAGTNGKGSTAATLASILNAAGYKTGLYTSPHLVRINERIRIDGIPVSDDDFASAYSLVSSAAQGLVLSGALPYSPSFFEIVTAMAFSYFASSSVQIAVLEVGMGGRLDATNTVEPILSIITDIGLDHQKYLGNTIGEIAKEKAGIMRSGVPAVTLPQPPETNDVLGNEMMRLGARAINASRNMPSVSPQCGGRTQFKLTLGGHDIEIDSPLVGRHQLRNLALAITAAEELASVGFPVLPEAIAKGVSQTRWPGRFQQTELAGFGSMVIDVAHNPAGAWALRAALSETYADRPRLMLFGAMRDKAILEMAQILFPTAEQVVVTTAAQNPRAAAPEELLKIAIQLGANAESAETVAAALKKIKVFAQRHRNPVIVLTGSIYIVGEAMSLLGIESV